jgi:hypothetical protein
MLLGAAQGNYGRDENDSTPPAAIWAPVGWCSPKRVLQGDVPDTPRRYLARITGEATPRPFYFPGIEPQQGLPRQARAQAGEPSGPG